MIRYAKSFVLASTAVLICSTPAAAIEYTIWHSPRTLESQGPIITVIAGTLASSSNVTFDGTGEEWIQMPLTLPSNVTVTGVVVCYQVSDPASYIAQIRITDMTDPDFASIRMDDDTPRTSTTPECITIPTIVDFDATLTLRMRIVAASGLDVIKIGGIGIVVDDGVGAAPGALQNSGAGIGRGR